jgi:hypothetical protein
MDNATKADAGDVKVAAAEEPTLPAKIKMTHTWGFIDRKGDNHLWLAGAVVDDAADIKMIITDCKFAGWVEVKGRS